MAGGSGIDSGAETSGASSRSELAPGAGCVVLYNESWLRVAALAKEELSALGNDLWLLSPMEQSRRLAAETRHAAGARTAKEGEIQTSDSGEH